MGLPSGSVTLLFTDIEGSTRLLHELGDRYVEVLAEHRRALRAAIAERGGVEVDTQGDAFFIAFANASDAVAAAQAAQRTLTGPVHVRIGIHTGEPTVTPEGYVGIDVHRGARICAAGHGGQILISKATRDALNDGTQVRDLGEHRLKDLHTPEWLFQVLAPDLEPGFPPLRSLSNTNLPAESSKFIGREHELTELGTLLGREDVRVLTLTGAGGTGKTRLAIRVAAEAVEHFKNGVFFVSLAPLTDPALVLGTIAETIGAQAATNQPPVDSLRRHLEGKQLLLLLDNFEHLLTAAPDISLLMASAPRLKAIVTSRERLRLAGEHEYAVPPLPDDDAVTLFGIRARAAKPSFRVELHRAPVLAICRRLDGLPLAVELAAARVKVLAPQALFERLEQRLPVLTGGPRDMPDRQRTLRATIDWSYALLDPHEQTVLARLAVFAGGWTAAAAEPICGATLEDLASLLDKSLLRHDEGGDGSDRFSMLETIREYAGDRLQKSGAADVVAGAHAHYFGQLADTAAEGRGHGVWVSKEVMARRSAWLDWLGVERSNLSAALEWLVEHHEGESAVQLVLSMWRLWFVRGTLAEGQAWTERVLALDETRRSPDFGFFLSVAAEFPRFRGQYARAIALEEEAIALLRRSHEQYRLASAVEALATMVEVGGNYTRAKELHEECLALGRESGDAGTIGHALNGLAVLAFRQGDYAVMAVRAEEELALGRSVGGGVAESIHNV
ncbi:MAG: adenylate/guanylate cyclase domain-containing protein, partial [Candidatus Dormibacteraeota bacterium]|nr:adenylate/guanylate cyclase domain-containing protein [Candidatus Dormibacteraeota bacterium]